MHSARIALCVVLALGACSQDSSDKGSSAAAAGVPASAAGMSTSAPQAGMSGGSAAGSGGASGSRAPTPDAGAAGRAGSGMAGRMAPSMAGRSSAGSSAGASGSAPSAAGSSAPGSPGMMSAGCGKDPAPAGTVNLDVGGMARLYIVDLPMNYDKTKAYRLVMAFHGAGLAAQSFKSFFKLTSKVGSEAIVAYLEALGNPTGWNYNRDLPYFDAVLTQLKMQYCIDESRVFATGHSSGGYFTNALGCQRGDVLRAIGPFSGGAAFKSNCQDKVAAWITHGGMDNIVDTMEGRDARDFGAEQSGCDTSMSMPVEPSPCVTYAGCDPINAVHYCECPGDHNLPSFGVQAVWAFFKAL